MFCCYLFFFFSSRRRHTRCSRDWSSDVCSSDLTFTHGMGLTLGPVNQVTQEGLPVLFIKNLPPESSVSLDRKSTRLNSSHGYISYAVFCLKKKKEQKPVYVYHRH